MAQPDSRLHVLNGIGVTCTFDLAARHDLNQVINIQLLASENFLLCLIHVAILDEAKT